MKIMNWNIDSGGQKSKVIDNIIKHNPDICILTEYRACQNDPIMIDLKKKCELKYIVTSGNLKENGVLLASKAPIYDLGTEFEVDDEYKKLAICINTFGINIIAFFCRNNLATNYFFDYITRISLEVNRNKTLITGDLNYGPTSSKPKQYKKIENLTNYGLVDLWRHFYGKGITQESWTHRNKGYRNKVGKGYSMVDHFIVSPLLMEDIIKPPNNDQNVLIIDDPDCGCSDHSITYMYVE